MELDKRSENAGKNIIFYDGVCGLCNNFVKFVLQNTTDSPFVFASLQSEFAQTELKSFGIDSTDLNSVTVVANFEKENTVALQKSDAVIFILKRMNAPYPVLGKLTNIVPKVIRDFGYGLVAKVRYKIFGKKEVCALPSKEEAEKFIEV